MKKQFIIRHPSQLNSLSTLPFLHRTGLGKIVLNETFQHPNKEQFEQQINSKYYACGCNEGAKALILGIICFGIGGAIGYFKYGLSAGSSLTLLFGGAVAMAVLGKMAGLIIANGKLRKTIKEVQSVWKPHWPESKTIGCG